MAFFKDRQPTHDYKPSLPQGVENPTATEGDSGADPTGGPWTETPTSGGIWGLRWWSSRGASVHPQHGQRRVVPTAYHLRLKDRRPGSEYHYYFSQFMKLFKELSENPHLYSQVFLPQIKTNAAIPYKAPGSSASEIWLRDHGGSGRCRLKPH